MANLLYVDIGKHGHLAIEYWPSKLDLAAGITIPHRQSIYSSAPGNYECGAYMCLFVILFRIKFYWG